MVRFAVVNGGTMALQTQGIALFDPFYAVHIMAVAAANVAAVHLALGKRAVNVYFL